MSGIGPRWLDAEGVRAWEADAEARGLGIIVIDSAISFNREMLAEFVPTERDRKIDDLAIRYHQETEAYDRTVCTGPIVNDSIQPITHRELWAVSANAFKVRTKLMQEAAREGITPLELLQAIRRRA